MMVLCEVVAAGGGNGVELVILQRVAEMGT